MADVGFIVEDLVVTGPRRGTYKVWIPKKHWHPDRTDYSAFATNLGDLNSAELIQAKKSAQYCYPLGNLQSGGAMPMDPETGVVSTDENNPEISRDTTTNVNGGTITKGKNYSAEGSGTVFKFEQTYGAHALSQMYTLATKTGFMTNTRDKAPKGNMAKLSIGTKVIVSGNYIIGQLPETQNDWINQLAPLNQSF